MDEVMDTKTLGPHNFLLYNKYVINCSRITSKKYTIRDVRLEECKIGDSMTTQKPVWVFKIKPVY